MIFIILGSQKFQFNRLLKYVDELVTENRIQEKVIAQLGHSDYVPKNYQGKQFYNQNEFKENIDNANLIITHAGTGSIITALKLNKKVIALPRLKKYDEHVDDHQIQIVENFTRKNYIFGAYDKHTLSESIADIHQHKFDHFESNNFKYITTIKDFLINE